MKTFTFLSLLTTYWMVLLIWGISLVRNLPQGFGLLASLLVTFALLGVPSAITFLATVHGDAALPYAITPLRAFCGSIAVFLSPWIVLGIRLLCGRNRLFPWARE